MAKAQIDYPAAADFLKRHRRLLIFAHERPDADAVGASLALAAFLNDNGRRAAVYFEETPGWQYRRYYAGAALAGAEDLAEADGWVLLDTPNPERAAVPDGWDLRAPARPLLVIDHHPDNRLFAPTLLDAAAAASAEIIYRISRELPEWRLTPAAATLLMLGLIGDTGGFRFENTKPDTLRHAASLLELGADYSQVVNDLFFNIPLNQQQLEADLIRHHLHLHCNGQFACAVVTPELLERHGIDLKNAEGVIDTVRATAGTRVVALLSQRNGSYKVSLRSKDRALSVGAVARALNGGGHELAAGCTIEAGSFEAAAQILLAHIQELF